MTCPSFLPSFTCMSSDMPNKPLRVDESVIAVLAFETFHSFMVHQVSLNGLDLVELLVTVGTGEWLYAGVVEDVSLEASPFRERL